MSPNTSNLLCLLAENGRLNKLEAVINAFKTMMAAHRGEVTCEVVTAKPLDQAQRQALEAALKVLITFYDSSFIKYLINSDQDYFINLMRVIAIG